MQQTVKSEYFKIKNIYRFTINVFTHYMRAAVVNKKVSKDTDYECGASKCPLIRKARGAGWPALVDLRGSFFPLA